MSKTNPAAQRPPWSLQHAHATVDMSWRDRRDRLHPYAMLVYSHYSVVRISEFYDFTNPPNL